LQLCTRHDPREHVEVAFASTHVVPQLPQLLVVFSAVSHPFTALPSQLPHPELHVAIWHVPVEQVAVAFARLHGTPHAPQFVRLLSCVSHPFTGLPSQFPHPAGHVVEHTPETQMPDAHTVPQPPQLFGSVCVLTSQPFVAVPSQFA
jgi:hypothetical protein